MIDLTQLAEARHQMKEALEISGSRNGAILVAAVDAVLEANQIIRCSQHGLRATPRCNTIDACSLQTGAFVLVTRGDTNAAALTPGDTHD